MLDKHVPYAEIWMTRPLSDSLPTQSLATGYHFEYYRLGDETEWARIEQSVGEFATETEALAYFQRAFLPYQEELQQRMLFVVTDTGEKIATCTAWFKKRRDGSYPLFHWLAVEPRHQGKGIAKALTIEVLRIFQKLVSHGPVYLHTQTWSHPAIQLYQKLGFTIIAENFDGRPNSEYPLAMDTLEKLNINAKKD